VTAKQNSDEIPVDQPEEGRDGYGGKDIEKRKYRKRHEKCQQPVQDRRMMMEKR